MAVRFLANTALAAIFVSKDAIYTYAQAANGQLVEIKGQIAAKTDNDLATYSVLDKAKFISPTKSDKKPAKKFTPLAAAPMVDFTSKKDRVSGLLPLLEGKLTG